MYGSLRGLPRSVRHIEGTLTLELKRERSYMSAEKKFARERYMLVAAMVNPIKAGVWKSISWKMGLGYKLLAVTTSTHRPVIAAARRPAGSVLLSLAAMRYATGCHKLRIDFVRTGNDVRTSSPPPFMGMSLESGTQPLISSLDISIM